MGIEGMGAIRTTVIKIKRKKKDKKSQSYLLNAGPASNKKCKCKSKNKTVSSYVVRALLGWVDKEPSYEDSQLSAGNIKVPVGAERFKII